MALHADLSTPLASARSARRCSALLFNAGNLGRPEFIAAALRDRAHPGTDIRADAQGCVVISRGGRVELTLHPSELPMAAERFSMAAERFSGVFEKGFGALSPIGVSTAICRHESHIRLIPARADTSAELIRDVMLWLAALRPAMAMLWGENGQLFTAAEFCDIAGHSGTSLPPELLISPRRFRAGHLFHGNRMHGFHADGCENILGFPVAVAEGPLSFPEAFAALKTLITRFAETGALPAEGDILCAVGDVEVTVHRIAPGPGLSMGRILLSCDAAMAESEALATSEHRDDVRPDTAPDVLPVLAAKNQPNAGRDRIFEQETALRAAMRG